MNHVIRPETHVPKKSFKGTRRPPGRDIHLIQHSCLYFSRKLHYLGLKYEIIFNIKTANTCYKRNVSAIYFLLMIYSTLLEKQQQKQTKNNKNCAM